jgi:ACS family glucarate transporter-like MFS transporter
MKKPSASQVVLIMLCLMYAITYMDRVNVSTAADGFARELHFSKTEIGAVFSAFAYPYLIFQIAGGWVSDRFGARRTLLACSFLWAIATILTGFAGGLITMLAARVLLGLGEGATFPASTAAMARWFSPARRGFAQGITHAAARIGNAITPAAVVLIMGRYGWRASFFVLGGFSLVWVCAWALTFHEDPRQHPRITPAEIAVLAPLQSVRHKTPWMELARRMVPVTMVYFCYGWTLWLFLAWIPQYFLHSYDLDLKKSALFSAAVFFAGVAGDTLGGLLTDGLLKRTGKLTLARGAMVSVCMLMALVSLLPLLFVHQLVVSVVCLSAGFFLCRDDDRADVGRTDGHRTTLFWHRKRDDEYRLSAGCNHLARPGRLADRHHGQLGRTVYRQHDPDGGRVGTRAPDARCSALHTCDGPGIGMSETDSRLERSLRKSVRGAGPI